jgi:hypothetical protein
VSINIKKVVFEQATDLEYLNLQGQKGWRLIACPIDQYDTIRNTQETIRQSTVRVQNGRLAKVESEHDLKGTAGYGYGWAKSSYCIFEKELDDSNTAPTDY